MDVCDFRPVLAVLLEVGTLHDLTHRLVHALHVACGVFHVLRAFVMALSACLQAREVDVGRKCVGGGATRHRAVIVVGEAHLGSQLSVFLLDVGNASLHVLDLLLCRNLLLLILLHALLELPMRFHVNRRPSTVCFPCLTSWSLPWWVMMLLVLSGGRRGVFVHVLLLLRRWKKSEGAQSLKKSGRQEHFSALSHVKLQFQP